jgi:hypothetical protein
MWLTIIYIGLGITLFGTWFQGIKPSKVTFGLTYIGIALAAMGAIGYAAGKI